MSLKFNVVTWYSKLLSIIFFIAVLPVLTFYIGTQYQLTIDVENAQVVPNTATQTLVKKERAEPKIDVGSSALEGKVFGKIQDIYEKDGKLWVNIDPADQVSTLECVFRAYDAGVSQDCEAPNGNIGWNVSTSTISMPLSEKAFIAVYYNDGTKIGLKPKVINSKNGKLYAFNLAPSAFLGASSAVSSSTVATSSPTLSDIAKVYNRILSYDGDDTYRWNPLMYIDIQAIKTTGAEGSSGPSSEVTSIEEVWRP